MPRTAIAPDAIRIEEEVWQEAFDQRAPRRRRPAAPHDGGPGRRATSNRPPAPAPALAPRPGSAAARPPAPQPATAPPRRPSPPPPRAGEWPRTETLQASEDSTDVNGRRTIVITGRGAERNVPWTTSVGSNRPARLPHYRSTFRPDRLAMWAMVLGLLLVFVAAMSAHS